ncbi:MAG: flippase [Actinobacteria bacterium]|nr:flippase [Actinomycetota bacterium]MCG2817474.1 flippase [Actinomycetes bacterium]MBU4178705.1 flippase [Actinomycetota bacterium]MBU4217957.1 flippase [Actinomycetota bacterium]MBU4357929.1 flippase [Actinomycetota bacterium]
MTREIGEEAESEQGVFYQSLQTVAKGSMVVFIGFGVGRLLTFARRLVIIHSISQADYGLFTLGLSIVMFATALCGLGLAEGTQRFVALYRGKGDLESVKGTFYSAFGISMVSTLLFMVVLMFASGPISSLLDKPGLSSILFVQSLIMPVSMAIFIIIAFYQGYENAFPKTAFGEIGLGVLTLATVVIAAALHWGFHGIVAAFVLGHLLALLPLLAYLSRSFPGSLKSVKPKYEIKELISFSLPIMFAVFAGEIMYHTDTVMLGYYESSKQVGIYNGAVPLYLMLAIFLVAVGFMFGPVAARMIGEKKDKALLDLYKSVTKWSFLFTLPACLLFLLYPTEVLRLFFGERYTAAATALQLLAVGEVVHTLLGPNDRILVAYGKTRLLLVDIVATAALNVALNMTLIPRWGINGAALATVISLVLANILFSSQVFRSHRLHPFSWNYAKSVIASTAGILVLYYPLKLGLKVTCWVLPLYYAVFLGVSLAAVILTGSVDDTDRALYRAIKRRFSGILSGAGRP